MDHVHGLCEKARRIAEHAVAGEDCVANHHGGLDAVRFQLGEGVPDIGCDRAAQSNLGSPIGVGRPDRSYMRSDWHVSAQGRRELAHRIRDAVIGKIGHDHACSAREALRDTVGKVVRLRPRTGKHHMAEMVGEGREQLFRILKDGFVQIARVSVERRPLAAHSLDHVRLTTIGRKSARRNQEYLA
jgi:hypothetical protein